jgi:D-xylonolactonase
MVRRTSGEIRSGRSCRRRIQLPVWQVSSLAFGGNELAELFITTAADPWQSPLAPPGYDFGASNMGGPLYRVRLDIRGKNEHRANFARLKGN